MTCRIPREDDRKIGGNQTERRFSSRNFLILGVETPCRFVGFVDAANSMQRSKPERVSEGRGVAPC